jgi:uncharacterized protein with PQ loop repeat
MEIVTMAVGPVAGALTTIAFLPQVMKPGSPKSAEDLSLGMLAFFSTGVLLWLIYGSSLTRYHHRECCHPAAGVEAQVRLIAGGSAASAKTQMAYGW